MFPISTEKNDNRFLSHRVTNSSFLWKVKLKITSFVRVEGPNVWVNETGLSFLIYIFLFVENCLYPMDINQFQSNAKKLI